MTTGRERAREAALHRHIDVDEDTLLMMERDADAASDVWEPIVQELVRSMEHFADRRHVLGWTEPLSRAKEALGE